MSQEVSKWLGSGLCHPNIPHLEVGYNPFTNHLTTSWCIQVALCFFPSRTENHPSKLTSPNAKYSSDK